jgi:RNA polymerase sigma-70 factor (ECF subfamily)
MTGSGGVAGVRTSATPLAEAEAFRAFYGLALPRVYGYFFSRCGGSAPLAEDLTQETFIAAVRELRKERKVDEPIAWVIGIARHKLLDHYRSKEREERVIERAIEEEDAKAVDPWPDPGTETERQRAIAALGAVPAGQRAALILRYMDGLGVPGVAKALGKSVHAAESLIARGRQNFRRAFAEQRDE